ncbi:hypothetical protein FHX49_001677 [Microbacterium endophyticum]|uniref:Uncharacterized protein n=1 Tax=Microbacterium endophyticum TaxID=1526412 RepID=A0A7W4V3E8_9MICO|nr:hypothetical protein [Microbacterium endophyticum]MBB2976107.1 hypothetical protein [Microbacterium endophyticum]NIK36404.1 hypothetical protein [Microbacterium endophyticum]
MSNVEDAVVVSEDLLSALEVIEQQPLRDRASSYASLHDDLARRLESNPGENRSS